MRISGALLWSTATAVIMVVACGREGVLSGRVSGLEKILDTAERNGAIRCAPRELAIARAHLQFAKLDVEQGQLGSAEEHLRFAEPNAQSALSLSPAEQCGGEVERPGDRDGDGLVDNLDKCPEHPERYNGHKDEDGCPDDIDTDGDGIADSVDNCPLDPEDKDGYLDEDGCPEPDNDLDGVPDAVDRKGELSCSLEPEDKDGFEDEDGCPDPDNDGDAVPDTADICPATPGYNGGDKPGCPRRASSVIVTPKEIRITQQIQFALDSHIIRPVSFKILDEVRDVLRENPSFRIEVQGHTDNLGPAAYNKGLSQRRAESVMQYLRKGGIDPARMTAVGYGMERPLVPNNSAKNREQNRRVQFIRQESTAGR